MEVGRRKTEDGSRRSEGRRQKTEDRRQKSEVGGRKSEGHSAKGIEQGINPYNIKTGRRIAACVPMHTFGHPVKLDELKKVLEHYNIPLIEDAAESIGSTYSPREMRGADISQGKHTGTFGKLGILSFNGNKLLTTGGGGIILTDDEELAKLAKHITTQAKIPHRWEFKHDFIGYNYRLTNIAAALGCAQMEQLDFFIQQKRWLAEQYKDFFRDTELEFVSEPEHCRSNYWLNAIIAKDREQRDNILEYTNKNSVMTRPIWELMNRLPMYANCQTDSLENSRWLANRVVNIPSSVIVAGKSRKLEVGGRKSEVRSQRAESE